MSDFYSQISVLTYTGREYVPQPTDELLTEFEKEHEFALPNSYRNFVLKFGAGVLSGLWTIAAPMIVEHDFELGAFNDGLHGKPEDRIHEAYGTPEFTRLFYFFADDGDHYFGWKLDEITDASNNEYAIYDFGYFDQLPRFATSFEQLVKIALTPAEHWDPEFEFTPFEI